MIEKTFLDRVSTYPGRVKLTPVSGQANTYDMVRADSPTEPGTPLDKVTFESIVHSRLTGRYYTPVLTREVSASSAGLTVSPLPTSGWIYDADNENRATSGTYTVEVSSNNGSGTKAAEAFSGDGWQSVGGVESWIEIYHAQAIKVRTLRMAVGLQYSSRLTTMQILGANEDKNWMALGTFTEVGSGDADYPLEYTGEFKYYRIIFTSDSSNRITISDLRYSLYDIATYTNKYVESTGFPSEWTTGQRVTISTPANINTFGVVSNTLNGLPIYSILQAGKQYELIFVDTGFAAKEV